MKTKIKKIGLILILAVLFGIIIFLAIEVAGKKAMLKNSQAELTSPDLEDLVSENSGEVIIYKGERYVYNNNITSILCMGIDVDKEHGAGEVAGEFGQADMLMLAVLDTKSGEVTLWNISRDSMTDVDVYNVDGEFVKTENMQACLAYAYGDGAHKSCENTVKAVSRLLYGMPIQSYAVLDLDAIRPLNDALGGVEVTIQEGDILPKKFVPNTTVLLLGDDVESYVRFRMTEMPGEPIDSNNNRMDRQRRYMIGFLQKALQMTKKDITTPVTLFNIARKDNHMITNLNVSRVAYLTTVFSKINFTGDIFQTVPGEVVAGDIYAEYHVDDEALYQMILDTFYVKQ